MNHKKTISRLSGGRAIYTVSSFNIRRTESRCRGVTNGDGQGCLLAAATNVSALDIAPLLLLLILLLKPRRGEALRRTASRPTSEVGRRKLGNAKPIVIVDRRLARTASFDAATMFMNGAMKLLRG